MTDDQPRVVVQRVGRWTYTVIIEHGMLEYGPDGMPWLVLGRRRAERKAAREYARFLRRRGWRSDAWSAP